MAAPTPVTGNLEFRQVEAGEDHVCGLTNEGRIYCWGYNRHGQLGDGTTTNRLVPTAVAGTRTYSALGVGLQHTCALDSGGHAYCWGSGHEVLPSPIAGDFTFRAISAGVYHTCALTTDDRAYCWGMLLMTGSGSTELAMTAMPVPVAGERSFRTLSVGGTHTCGVASDDSVYCWGSNQSGELGASTGPCMLDDPDYACSAVPVKVASAVSFSVVAAGGWMDSGHTCALSPTGAAYCWGYKGSSDAGDQHVPVRAGGSIIFESIAGSPGGSCGLTQDGSAYCWIGASTAAPVLQPTP